jgi:Na+-transporting methylmalonyl-CoA/oxaloacetate decarboxylase gamma subunit
MTGATAVLQALAATPLAQTTPSSIADGAGITFVGMLTVFFGLAALTLLLPVLRRLVERDSGKGASAAEGVSAESRGLTHAEVVAISTAIHAHIRTQNQAESMKLTWEDHDKPYTPWRFAGRAEHISGLKTIQSRIRSR